MKCDKVGDDGRCRYGTVGHEHLHGVVELHGSVGIGAAVEEEQRGPHFVLVVAQQVFVEIEDLVGFQIGHVQHVLYRRVADKWDTLVS